MTCTGQIFPHEPWAWAFCSGLDCDWEAILTAECDQPCSTSATPARGNVGAVVEAARAVVARHRGTGDLPQILDGLDRLDAALKAHDAAGAAPSKVRATCPHSWYDDECKCGLPPRAGGQP